MSCDQAMIQYLDLQVYLSDGYRSVTSGTLARTGRLRGDQVEACKRQVRTVMVQCLKTCRATLPTYTVQYLYNKVLHPHQCELGLHCAGLPTILQRNTLLVRYTKDLPVGSGSYSISASPTPGEKINQNHTFTRIPSRTVSCIDTLILHFLYSFLPLLLLRIGEEDGQHVCNECLGNLSGIQLYADSFPSMVTNNCFLNLACDDMVPSPGLQRSLARFVFVVMDGQSCVLWPHEP